MPSRICGLSRAASAQRFGVSEPVDGRDDDLVDQIKKSDAKSILERLAKRADRSASCWDSTTPPRKPV